MPMTTDQSLLRLFATSDNYVTIDTGGLGGFGCLVGCGILASDGFIEGCKHLLAESVDTRDCWAQLEGDDDELESALDESKVAAGADQDPLDEEWVPVLTAQEEPSSTWWVWFAVPVADLKAPDGPEAAVARLAKLVEEEFDELNRQDEDDEDEDEDEDDDL